MVDTPPAPAPMAAAGDDDSDLWAKRAEEAVKTGSTKTIQYVEINGDERTSRLAAMSFPAYSSAAEFLGAVCCP
jgi:hypothetical protein